MGLLDRLNGALLENTGAADRALRLGLPSRNPTELLARRVAMAALNPSGFRTPKKKPRGDRTARRAEADRVYRERVRLSQELERAPKRRVGDGWLPGGLTELQRARKICLVV